MNESVEIALLLDFYGQLLTPRQYEILDLHYNNDISLGEIGEQYNISRQGVYDSIKKGREALRRYEEKLGLVKRFSRHNETIRNILTELKKLEAGSTQRENKDIIDFCVMELEKVINEL
ncbi:MAG: putative DNA-binding protein [Clostridiaceae bacterium]|nr:putative DNA-binding protein [Clostridiaceae bacterium]